MIADSLLLCLSKTHDYSVISNHFSLHLPNRPVSPEGYFKLFWSKAYAEGHAKIAIATKGCPERCQFAAGFIKTDLIKAVFCV